MNMKKFMITKKGENMLKVYFWEKESGNLMSHGKGLRAEDVAALQQLKEGDRLILWNNGKSPDGMQSNFTLKVFQPKVAAVNSTTAVVVETTSANDDAVAVGE